MTRPTALPWAETVKRAEALGEIIEIVADYLPGDADPKETIGRIIRVIETKAGHQFIAGFGEKGETEPSDQN